MAESVCASCQNFVAKPQALVRKTILDLLLCYQSTGLASFRSTTFTGHGLSGRFSSSEVLVTSSPCDTMSTRTCFTNTKVCFSLHLFLQFRSIQVSSLLDMLKLATRTIAELGPPLSAFIAPPRVTFDKQSRSSSFR
eukprot:g33645.t1